MRSTTWARTLLLGILLISLSLELSGQTTPATNPLSAMTGTTPPAPQKVVVDPVANDDQIARRLEKILAATERFETPHVEVKQGDVFLYGTAETDEYKFWAGTVVQNTEDVIAVVNKMGVKRPDLWNLGPALRDLTDLWRSLLRSLPFISVAFLILGISLWLARVCSIVVLMTGLYLTMNVSGTTQLALTLLGGTGLIGLVLVLPSRTSPRTSSPAFS